MACLCCAAAFAANRYLTRVITVFNGTGAKYDVVLNPVGDVVEACGAICKGFGAGVTLLPGPPKKEQRIMEKAHDGNYAAVRDLGRLSLIVENIALVPEVLAALCGCADFEVIRIKNRLDPGHKAVESAGYRDVQVLVRERKGGWIVEVQVIPKEMYELKKSCGHTGYTKYRFILEACKRARIQKAINAFAAGTSRAQQAAAASAKVESRGPCSRCGEPVLVTQERETDGTGAYFHANPADCSAATTSPGGAAGAPRLKKHVSRNAVHPTDGEAEA